MMTDTQLDPKAAWSRRVRWIGGLIQLAFATFWLVRGSLTIGGDIGLILTIVSAASPLAATVYGIRVAAGVAPRPVGPEAKRIEVAVTVATIIQLVASFAAPAIVIALDKADWVLPSIAVTIGPLLIWLDRRVDVPRLRPVGWALIIAPIVLIFVLSGNALAAATGLGAGVVLLGTATAGFRDLAKKR